MTAQQRRLSEAAHRLQGFILADLFSARSLAGVINTKICSKGSQQQHAVVKHCKFSLAYSFILFSIKTGEAVVSKTES